MRRMNVFILIAVICSFCLNAGLTLAAEGSIYEQLTSPGEAEMQWLWGEIVSVDLQKNSLLIKYLDYETDQEEEVKIYVDEKTTYENAKSLVEMKPQDTVAIDYIISLDGGNLATNISLEKLEDEGLSEEMAPADLEGLGKMEESEEAPQEKVEEKTEPQKTVIEEPAPSEKIESQPAVVEEPPLESENPEMEPPASTPANSSLTEPMPDTSSGQ